MPMPPWPAGVARATIVSTTGTSASRNGCWPLELTVAHSTAMAGPDGPRLGADNTLAPVRGVQSRFFESASTTRLMFHCCAMESAVFVIQ